MPHCREAAPCPSPSLPSSGTGLGGGVTGRVGVLGPRHRCHSSSTSGLRLAFQHHPSPWGSGDLGQRLCRSVPLSPRLQAGAVGGSASWGRVTRGARGGSPRPQPCRSVLSALPSRPGHAHLTDSFRGFRQETDTTRRRRGTEQGVEPEPEATLSDIACGSLGSPSEEPDPSRLELRPCSVGPTGAGFIPTLGSGLLPVSERMTSRGVEARGQGCADPSTPLPCGVLPVALTSRLMEIPTG